MEKIVVEIDLSAKEATSELDKLNKAIIVTDGSSTDLTASFEDVNGEVKTLTQRTGELEDRLYELAQAGDTTSQEFKDLTKEAGRLKKAQKEVDLIVDRSSRTLNEKFSTAVTTATGGMVIAEGVMSSLGIESAETEESMAKMVQAMAMGEAIKGLNETTGIFTKLGSAIKKTTIFQKASTAAQWLWNTAMNANPIGVVIIAITSLIAAGYALVKLFQFMTDEVIDNTDSLNKNSKAIDEQVKATEKSRKETKRATDQQLAMAKAQGKSKDEIRKLEKAIADKTIKDIEATKEIAKKTLATQENTLANEIAREATEEEIEIAKANVSKAKKILDDETANLKKANEDKIDLLNRFLVEDETAKTNARRKNEEKRKEDIKNKKEQEEREKKEKKEREEKAKLDAEQKAKEEKEKSEEELQKVRDELKQKEESRIERTEEEKVNLEREKALKEIENIKLTEEEKRQTILDVNAYYDELEKEAKDKDDEKVKEDNAKKLADKIKLIEDERELDKQKIRDKKMVVDAISQFADAETGIGKALLIAKQAMALKETIMDLKRITFKGAEAIGSAGVSTAQNVAESSKIGFPQNIITIAGAIAQGVGIVKSVKSAVSKTKAKTNVPSSSLPNISTPNIPSLPPAFNVVGGGATNQLADAIGSQSQQPVQAYVVANDVTTSQSLDRNIVEGASI